MPDEYDPTRYLGDGFETRRLISVKFPNQDGEIMLPAPSDAELKDDDSLAREAWEFHVRVAASVFRAPWLHENRSVLNCELSGRGNRGG